METAAKHLVFLDPPGIFEVLIIALFIILIVYGSLKSTRNLGSKSKRSLLLALYILSFLLVVSILFDPAYREESYKEDKKNLAIVIDNSWSMNLAGNDKLESRYTKIKTFLSDNKDFISKLNQDFHVDFYTFGDELKISSLDSALSQKASESKTDFENLILNLKNKNSMQEIDIAIIISDGSDKKQTEASISQILENVNFPINTIAPLDEEKFYDVWIDDIASSDVTFLRYPHSIDVSIKSDSTGSVTIPVSLYEGDKLISIKEAALSEESEKTEVHFEISPKSLGRKIYTVSIPQLSDELITENNQKSFSTDVIINKIRVLHIAGRPSWDVKFLRKSLKQNPNIDLVSFFILRDPSDLVFASERELSLIPFPVNEIFTSELSTFDVVVFQDFQFQPYGIFGFHLNNLKDYITRDGGAFLMIGGSNSFNSGNYGRTSVSDILPVKLDYSPKTLSETISSQKFLPELTDIGKRHPITRVTPNIKENEKKWQDITEVERLNMVRGLNNSALELLSTKDGLPVFAIENIGEGKAAAFLSDSSWKWNFTQASEGNISPLYDKFWNRIFLWLVNDPELSDIKISTDKPVYNPGESAKVEIRTLSDEESVEDNTAIIEMPDGTENEIALKSESSNIYSGDVELKQNGMYKISYTPQEENEKYKNLNRIENVFIVEAPQDEIKGPTANAEFLKLIAKETGGRDITTNDALDDLNLDTSKKKTITGYKTKKLWDNPAIFLLVVGMLSTQWILRRRWGLK